MTRTYISIFFPFYVFSFCRGLTPTIITYQPTCEGGDSNMGALIVRVFNYHSPTPVHMLHYISILILILLLNIFEYNKINYF